MLDEILPDIIDARMYNYLKVDNQYIVTFIIYGYPKEIDSFNFLSYFPNDIEINISVHLAKQNSMDVIRKVTSSISINETEYGDSSKSNQSRDILNKLKEDAKQLRYEMQINNQEIYNVYTFVKIKSDNEKKMLDILMYLKNSLITKMLKVNTLNFRHLVGYIATLPFANYQKKYLSNYFVNMTTNNLKILFPFYTKTIMHENGILFGKVKNDNRICCIDLFNKSNLNSNMCIFGSSGTGKSYFTKLIILRNYLKNIKQYIIDPEGEYINMPGVIVDLSKEKINLLQINEYEIEDNFFENKVNKVANIICNICDIEEKKEIIKEYVYKVYDVYNISQNKESLYIQNEKYLNPKLKTQIMYPTINDVIELMQKDKKNLKLVKILKKNFEEDFCFFNGITSVDMNSSIVVYNISKINNKSKVCEYLLQDVTERLNYKINSLIYIDEVWKLIYKNEKLKNLVFDLYKTVRKRNCGIVTITQDISDIFTNENLNFGKSIFNNSYIKMFFKMEYQDSEVLKNIGIIEDEDYDNMIKMKKKEAYMYLENSSIILNISANDFEKKIIEGDVLNDNSSFE